MPSLSPDLPTPPAGSPSARRSRSASSPGAKLGKLTLILLAAFGPSAFVHAPLLQGELPLFRDVRHFYQPMELRQQRAWSEGRVPLWNDVEGIGFPEFAEPTAATFYPGKIVFAAPIPWGTRWFLYFVGHAGIACLGARRFARACGLSSTAGLLAGAAYAASGELLFQSCNPVYLVGAAWLPWALGEALLLRRTADPRHIVGLAGACSLAVLGGDPQTVYHVALLVGGAFAIEAACAAIAHVCRACCRVKEKLQSDAGRCCVPSPTRPNARRGRLTFAGQLVFAGALTLGIAAVQLVPSVEWFRQSGRAAHASAATPHEDASDLNRYDFSVGPWRWSEFLVPEALGRPFPIQRRWSYAFVPDDRIWTPSYYLGLTPILLLPAAFAVRRIRRRARLPLALAIVALGAALGRFGLGFFLDQIARWFGDDVALPGQWGGPYAIFVESLPLYDLFRYPAKWMPAASLGIAVAGGAGLDALRTIRGRRTAFVAACGAAGLFLLAYAATRIPAIESRWLALPILPDAIFGPWDAAGSLADLRGSLLHVAVVAASVAGLVAVVRFADRRSHARKLVAGALIAVAALDAAVANRDLVPTGNYDIEPATTIDWTSLDADAVGPDAMRFFRGSIDRAPQRAWRESSSADRLVALAEWERASYRPRLGPGRDGPPAFRSHASLEPIDLAPYLSNWRDSRLTNADPDAAATIARLADHSVGILALPPGVRPVGGEFLRRVEVPPTDAPIDLWRLPQARPRWSVSTNPDLVARAQAALANETTLAVPRGELKRLATNPPLFPLTPRDTVAPGVNVHIKFVESRSDFASIDYESSATTLLVWNDRYDAGWRAKLVGGTKTGGDLEVPVGRIEPNGRFVVLPAGEGRLSFVYRPTSLYVGLFASIVALAVATALLALPATRHRRRRRIAKPDR